jgi:hypothetical protein
LPLTNGPSTFKARSNKAKNTATECNVIPTAFTEDNLTRVAEPVTEGSKTTTATFLTEFTKRDFWSVRPTRALAIPSWSLIQNAVRKSTGRMRKYRISLRIFLN